MQDAVHQWVAAALVICMFAAANIGAQNPPSELFLNDPNNLTGNASRNCLSRRSNDFCPDPELHFYLYSGNDGEAQEINVSDTDWINDTRYDPELPTVMLIHGYRGGDSLMPMVILKNAYIRRGTYNVITVDWGRFVQPRCYIQAVGNMRHVAKCTGHMLSYLESVGVDTENMTCVGHSLGAHVCGVLANYAPQQLDRIIGLDPARPLIPNRWSDRLDSKDARVVQVIHTDTRFYGSPGVLGTADFCVNNGAQPFCEKTRNAQLCSHAHAICYQAESLYHEKAATGYPCEPACPNRYRITNGGPTLLGQFMDNSAQGMYCVTSQLPPYCLDDTVDPEYGDPRCCPVAAPRRFVPFFARNSSSLNDDR